MKKWQKAALAIAVVAGGAVAAWAATNDTEGRALREQAAAKLAGKNKNRRPTMRAVGRNGTTLELSTQGLAACHKDEVAKTMAALAEPPAGTEGIAAMNDPSRVYVVTPEGDLGTAPRDELVSLRRRGFSLAPREMVAEQKATLSCGDPTVKCSPRWLEEMAATYSTGEVGHMMAALRFGRIACVGDDWEGSLPLKY